VNVLRIGSSTSKNGEAEGQEDEEGDVVEEGASDTEGEEEREELGVPGDSKGRMKFFLSEEKRKEFEFQQGRCYGCDFFNGYLDFNEFALRLPMGFTMNIVRYWAGQPLRYVGFLFGALLFLPVYVLSVALCKDC
jgi:hypothetical protein